MQKSRSFLPLFARERIRIGCEGQLSPKGSVAIDGFGRRGDHNKLGRLNSRLIYQ